MDLRAQSSDALAEQRPFDPRPAAFACAGAGASYRLCLRANAQRETISWVLDEPRDCLYLLQRWYVAQCDSEWEHSYGVSIDTLDNSGWTLRIDLAGTSLEGATRLVESRPVGARLASLARPRRQLRSGVRTCKPERSDRRVPRHRRRAPCLVGSASFGSKRNRVAGSPFCLNAEACVRLCIRAER